MLLGTNIGGGILVGEYAGGYPSDRLGRKWTLVLSALVTGAFIWPIALTNDFLWLWLWNFLFALGMGMALATNAVYLHEIAPPTTRQELTLRTQAISPVGQVLVAGLLGFWLVPDHYQAFLYVLSAIPIVLLIPLGVFALPESPRWLEAKGRVQEADAIVSRWEQKAEQKFGSLPVPQVGRNTVIQTEKVPISEVFKGEYRNRTWLLFVVWFLGYSGIVYGFGSFFPTFAVLHTHWSAHELFFWSRIIPVPFMIIAFFVVAAFGERYERKDWALGAAILFAAVTALILVFTGTAYLSFVSIVVSPLVYIWLFSMYNYTAAAYPTRLRSVGTGWTDGVGHLGSILGTSLLVGRLFDWTHR